MAPTDDGKRRAGEAMWPDAAARRATADRRRPCPRRGRPRARRHVLRLYTLLQQLPEPAKKAWAFARIPPP